MGSYMGRAYLEVRLVKCRSRQFRGLSEQTGSYQVVAESKRQGG